VNADTGVVARYGGTAFTAADTFELKVLDGFSFSQSTQQTTIQISEAGSTPVRGQRAFNVTLDPVDITFSTYLRPKVSASIVVAEEQYLWNALFGSTAFSETGTSIGGTPAGVYTAGTGTLVVSTCSADLTLGGIYTLQGVTAVTANLTEQFNTPVVVTARTPSTGAATSITFKYLNPPEQSNLTLNTTTTKAFTKAWTTNIVAGTTAAHAQVTSAPSNKNQLQKFGLIFQVDNAIYAIDNCVVDQASIDFSLDGIATVAWTVKGTKLNYMPNSTLSASTFGSATVDAVPPSTTNAISSGVAAAPLTIVGANYITNKLSTMQLKADIGGAGTAYTVALTGGNLTVANNVSYVTPSNLGVVNEPIGYFTGSRSISGNVTAYLRVGANATAQLLKDILTANASETKFFTQIEIGGAANATRVEVRMPGVLLQVPTVETADVISTTINFTAQGHNALDNTYDIAGTNDIRIRYFAAV
jgi:hypothetical protein